MNAEQELKLQWYLQLSGFQVCAGKLACIFARLQKGSPLSDDEIEREEKNAATEILEAYENLRVDIFSE